MPNITETPVVQKEETKISKSALAMNTIHQPVVVVVDNSSSMLAVEKGETKTNLQLAEDLVNLIGSDPNLSLADQQTVDFAVLNFHDVVEVRQNWIPLSQFERNIKIPSGGCTAFHEAVIQSLLACKVLFETYKTNGISCKRPQIFLFTDGYPTDSNNFDRAKKLCEKYLDGESPKCRLHVILLPGASDKAAKALSPNIRTYLTKDCQHGLPTALGFINSSIVSFSSTAVGNDATLTMDAKYMTGGSKFGSLIGGKFTGSEQVSQVDLSDNYVFA